MPNIEAGLRRRKATVGPGKGQLDWRDRVNTGFARLLLGGAMGLAMAAPAWAAGAPAIDADDIGGVVTGAKGPEAGVWVIAETTDLPTRMIRIVVTDDQGRYVVPDLPKAGYKLFVRGYGLTDSQPVTATPGSHVDVKVAPAAGPREAAQIYPANYWFSLLRVPPESAFPGTGPEGNGISPKMRTQQDWIGHLKENCQFCHQIGSKVTRELEAANSVEAWDQRVQKERDPDDAYRGDNKKAVANKNFMGNSMSGFGRQQGLKMFADWTDRIAQGAIPAMAPPRPAGIERNAVITLYDFGELFIHDSSASDKRNPTVNAGGPVYGVQNHSGQVVELNPATATVTTHKLVNLKGEWDKDMNNHTSTMDGRGRYWFSTLGASGVEQSFCNDPAQSPFAKFFPRAPKGGRTIGVFDPKTGKNELIPVCFNSHHLNFTTTGDTLFFSGDTEVVGWVDTKVWDRTHDAAKAVGWCPLVLDTSGDGKVDPDRTRWQLLKEGGGAGGEGAAHDDSAGVTVDRLDPAKDTRVIGFQYGMGVNPKDQTYWVAKYTPTVPSGILRVDPGRNPPETCRTEYYEAPKVDGKYRAYNARGVDVDADGIAWVAFGTGQIGRFDRSKCKVTNGPAATGQHCPEGWQLIDTPGPKMAGTDVGSDWFYLTWVDLHDSAGLGRNTPFFPGSNSDALLAYQPEAKRLLNFRIPYPQGFYVRGIDGRIDDANAGWKGRGLWANYSMQPTWHMEEGEESTPKMAHFQIRPDPLAH
jgi:hypothetical protein